MFIFPICIVTYSVVLLVFTQSYPVLCNLYSGRVVGGCLGGRIVATWLAMRLWIFSRLALVLYMCTSSTLHVLPSYGCGSCGLNYVSSGMT